MEIPANAAHMLPSSTQRSLVSVDPRMLPAYQGGDRPPAVCAEDEIQKRLWSYDKAIEATPEVCKLHFFKARLLRKLGRLAEAEVCLRTAHELQPTSARVVALLADLLGRQGQLSGAARVLETAIELTEDDRDRWREQLVGLLLAGRRYEEAARQITSLVQRNPRPELATMLTRALDGLTRDAEANVAPSARAKFEQAAESLREGHPAEAETAALAIVRQRPGWVEAWIVLRGARIAQGLLCEADATGAEWRAAAPSDDAAIEMTTARRMSARGLLFDPREPLRLQSKATALKQVHSRDELLLEDNAHLVIDPGGDAVRYEPILSVEEGETDSFAVETETSESFVATFRNAAVVGRGLVVTERNEVVIETMLPAPSKYQAASRDGRLWFDPAGYADGALPVRTWDRPAFLMVGPTDTSFGDWVWKFPPRLTLARAVGLDVPLVVSSRLSPRYLRMLELLGSNKESIARDFCSTIRIACPYFASCSRHPGPPTTGYGR